ncbi:hypothetical protein [Allorhizobium borbori]|uniref:Uncharacterized protein n=1 Tax=Allorhizobium borbori TaxID=485907 RepID=A0A7W6JZG0_9HYPH|nr:hypothetical protein [Allorhizobium borbori]MBB4102375.1 hypothetical protein [Allorhizobium borbori]
MTTLLQTLASIQDSAVILGHVHRRQADLDTLFAKKSDRDFSQATTEDLFDLCFVDAFFGHLARPYMLKDMQQWQADTHARYEKDAAVVAAGISRAAKELHVKAGMLAAQTLMFGTGPRSWKQTEKYLAIAEEPRGDASLAA